VVVCSGDWSRVVASDTVMGLTHLPQCGVFLDPPYGAARTADIYTHDDVGLHHAVRDWCAAHGGDPRLRIVLAGYAGDGNETLAADGWRELSAIPKRRGAGYGNRTGAAGNGANRQRERLWLSPHCLNPDQRELFAAAADYPVQQMSPD
jgi:DNA adenine methylase